MFKNKSIKTISIVTLLLIVSTVAQAAGFNPGRNNYQVDHGFYDEATSRDYNYSWEVSITPGRWTNYNNSINRPSTKPSLPVKPSRPENEVKPSLPQAEEKPSFPNKPNKPESQPSRPSQPETKPNPPVEVERPSNNSNLSQIEAEVIRLVNIERQKQGLSQFKTSGQLSNVARVKSEDMYRNNYFSHNSPKYGSPFDMIKSFGISYTSAGENIAKGYSSAQAVVRGWMNSSGHRANILNPSFNTIGVGAYTDSRGTIYWTQLFTN